MVRMYLGDGVYANYDIASDRLVLTTGTHEEDKADNVIVLDAPMLSKLWTWVKEANT